MIELLSFQWWLSYDTELTGIKSYKNDLVPNTSVTGHLFSILFSYIYQTNSKFASVFKSSELVIKQ